MLMNTLVILIVFPFLAAVALLLLPQYVVRKWLVLISTALLCAAAVYLLAAQILAGAGYYTLEMEAVNWLMTAAEVFLAAYILILGIRKRQYWAAILIMIQTGLMLYFDFTYRYKAVSEHHLFVDQFSVIMALVIGVAGSLICVYAVDYMKEYHHLHPEVQDRLPFFFFTMFVLLSAMFGVVFANNLRWLYFCWEITTVCSFWLIGYTGTEEAVLKAFRALKMNLLGGLAFAVAIVYIFIQANVTNLDQLTALDKTAAMIPALLIALAGMIKSAQFPFASWLLGAIAAPAPVSALLQSSTVVKAGVYIIIRLAPVLNGAMAGLLIALVGAVTFLVASCIAISQPDARRVLAYSTVAGLGLIITCGACGAQETVWAALFLIIFHAVSTLVLVLCAGLVEHRFGGCGIETMEGLVVNMPHIAAMMMIGMAGMFLAPFGMLVSKWAALEGLIRINPFLAVFVAYGSAATLFYWTKWMGKLITVKAKREGFAANVSLMERLSLIVPAVLVVGSCFFFPWVSEYLVEPYLMSTYGSSMNMSTGSVLILFIMMGLLLLLPLVVLFYKNPDYVEAYMGGANVAQEDQFLDSYGCPRDLVLKNYYLESYFGESKLFDAGVVSCTCLILVMLGVGFL